MLRPIGTTFVIEYPPSLMGTDCPYHRAITFGVIGYKKAMRFWNDIVGEMREELIPISVVETPSKCIYTTGMICEKGE